MPTKDRTGVPATVHRQLEARSEWLRQPQSRQRRGGVCRDVYASSALAADAGGGEGQDLESPRPAENHGPAGLEQVLLWEVGSGASKEVVGSICEGGPAGGGCGVCYRDCAGQRGSAGGPPALPGRPSYNPKRAGPVCGQQPCCETWPPTCVGVCVWLVVCVCV